MLSGERRWTSARRGGMTVLGKVSAPKPINLPSQRLENHGLDPSVEIVPNRGTHGWGSKSSSSSSNAWGSPNTDGGSGSPSYLSGRPSSGGTGTRPSTAGSDRAHDPVTNAWGSNSRPSSSSGVLTSNQTSQTKLRPQSAETRPGSSQLSRFAEPHSDNSGAWGGSRTSEKLGMTPSKNDGFSLSTGDFPSLGSEKDNSRKETESQDHGSHSRPGSSSGVALVKEHPGDFSSNIDAKAGGAGSWRNDGSMHGEDGTRSDVEKWHADPQPYPNSNIHHLQHLDSWRGPPVSNHPGGVWFRGPPGGPPFGSPVPPGGFPMEPFPYFHRQMPPPLANPQPVCPPNAAPRGPHPNNGDMYRPHVHDPYIRPGMPVRPGCYPGPVPYDNYYGPPLGYCHSNERDAHFMGMPMRPAAYNIYPGHNVPDSRNSFERTSGHGPNSNPMVSEQVEAVGSQDARGPYKDLLKQHDSWGGRDEKKWDDNSESNSLHSLKGEASRKSAWENGCRADDRMDGEMDERNTIHNEGTSSEAVDKRAMPQNVPDDSSVKKFEHLGSYFHGVTALKDSNLIQKIEGLNAKARTCDVRQDVKPVFTTEEHKSKLQVGNMMVSGDKSFESTVDGGTTTSRKPTHIKPEYHGIARVKNQMVDGRLKAHSEVSHASHGPENSSAATKNLMAHSSGKDDGDSMLRISDVKESQRSKMKELAERIKQREKEEEERTRDQRAKALAKLEELNRRMQAGDSVAEKLETVPRSVIQCRQESSTPVRPTDAVVHNKELETVASNAVQNKREQFSIGAPPVAANKSGLGSAVSYSQGMIALSGESSVNEVEKSASTISNVRNECAGLLGKLKPFQSDGNYVDAASSNSSHIHDGKQKRSNIRRKQNSSLEKNSDSKPSPYTTEVSKDHSDSVCNAVISFGSIGDETTLKFQANLPVNPSVTSEYSANHRKKSRSGKNRHKAEEASSVAALPSIDIVESSSEIARPKTSEAISVQSKTNLTDSNQSLDPHSSLANEGHNRFNNQSKSQHPHRTRNQQGTKLSEAVWAPVRSQNKVEVSDEAVLNVSVETAVKDDQMVQKNSRSKRAEMEIYIPKAAAKELSHQGSSHQEVVLSTNIASNEALERHESRTVGTESSQTSTVASAKIGSTMESRNGDIRQNKPGKMHGSWRQRGMAEPTTNSNPSRNFQRPSEDHQHSDEWNDGWYMPENPEPVVSVTISKNQGVAARGKRHQHKDHKGLKHNHNPEEKRTVGADAEVRQTDSPVAAKENHVVGERSVSHWQPKCQPPPATDQECQPNRTVNVVVSEGGGPLLPRPDKDTFSVRSHQFLSEKTNFEEGPDVERHNGPKRERKTAGRRGRPVSSHSTTGVGHGKQVSGGSHSNGNANRHYSREHESHGEWSGSGEDSKRRNSHYEYQPVGPQNNKSNNFEPHNSGSRYSERGQGQSRRGSGNFGGRRSGSVQVDGGYEQR